MKKNYKNPMLEIEEIDLNEILSASGLETNEGSWNDENEVLDTFM